SEELVKSEVTDLLDRERLMPFLTTKDLIEYGLIPEFVGRLPVHVNLQELQIEDLTHILVEPRNALVKQYQAYFAMEGHDLQFTEEALTAIAELAWERKTGVRSLRSILESVLHELMFRLPDFDQGSQLIISGEMIKSGNANVLLKDLDEPEDQRESA
ncbi:MAG: ATP-dependent Clp protease ATP-binding subunit ClpX, partial [Planctomycetes bacterium]|nr:ATP-dependent Clp protease ATP-binding subunit ClpX [Planctomycetota bacterium]